MGNRCPSMKTTLLLKTFAVLIRVINALNSPNYYFLCTRPEDGWNSAATWATSASWRNWESWNFLYPNIRSLTSTFNWLKSKMIRIWSLSILCLIYFVPFLIHSWVYKDPVTFYNLRNAVMCRWKCLNFNVNFFGKFFFLLYDNA